MIRKQLRESFFLGVFALITVCLLSPSASAIKISDNFSIDGFLDMSAGATIAEDEDGDSELTAFAGFDQLEIDLNFSFDKLSARADIERFDSDAIELEQAFITYAFSDMININAGRFLSSIGFEAAEPTDMFQYSTSTGSPYPGYQNGVSLSISPSDMIGIYASLVSGVWGGGDDTDLNNPGFEAQIALMPIEGLTAKVGFAGDVVEEVHAEEEGKAHDHDDEETYLKSEINAWVMYSMDKITVAAEFDLLPNYYAHEATGIHFLAMANIGITDEIGLTVRFSGAQNDLDNEDEELRTSFTISPSYAFNDNLGSLIELKQILGDDGETQIAFETIMTF